ncbi:MAG: DNA polymerase Y family protein [Chloroflexi bacterium]|nr:DNA polymerase Y family protein [Chloroflexota bacterium]
MSGRRGRLPRRIACLLLPHFALQVAARDQPALLATVAAVSDGTRVIAVTSAAAAAGVRAGMRLADARARCPALTLVPAAPAAEATANAALLALLAHFSPTVEPARPGVVFLDWSGLGRAEDGETAQARLLTRTVASDLGLTAHTGIADGPFTAAVAAHHQARVDAPALVPAGASAVFLAPFAISVLPGVRPVLARLLALGLRRVGDLAALPAAEVARRFGPAVAQAHALARGQDRRPLQGQGGPAERSVSVPFEPPETSLDRLLFAATGRLRELQDVLEAEGLAASDLLVTLRLEDGATVPLAAPLLALAGSTRVVLEALRARLDGEPLAAPVAELTLTLTGVGPERGRQIGLLDAARAARRPRQLEAATRLHLLLGPTGARRARLQPALLPEAAFTWQPWDGDPVTSPIDVSSAPTLLPATPGLCLVAPPRPVRVHVEHGRVVALHDGPRWRRVIAADGPYRVATGWWPGETPVERDYYLVAIDDAGLVLLYEAAPAGGWFLAAEFE